MITHLISTTELVKLVNDNSTSLTEETLARQYVQCLKYANFISQKPELYMFVPCDEEGDAMEYPIYDTDEEELYLRRKHGQYWTDYVIEERNLFEKAQSRVLFKGCYITQNEPLSTTISNDGLECFVMEDMETLETVLTYGELALTETALKQIGL